MKKVPKYYSLAVQFKLLAPQDLKISCCGLKVPFCQKGLGLLCHVKGQ